MARTKRSTETEPDVAPVDPAAERHQRVIRMGKIIKEAREGEKLSQAELGDLMTQPGFIVPQTTVSRWERGLVDMSAENLRGIETALQLPYGTLSRRAGYIEEAAQSLEEVLLSHPDIHPDYRSNVVSSVRAWVKVSRRLLLAEAADGGRRRVRFTGGNPEKAASDQQWGTTSPGSLVKEARANAR